MSSVSVRVRSAWTATFGPAAAAGFAAGAQNAFVPYGSRTGTAPRDELPAETAVADSARTAARPTSLVTRLIPAPSLPSRFAVSVLRWRRNEKPAPGGRGPLLIFRYQGAMTVSHTSVREHGSRVEAPEGSKGEELYESQADRLVHRRRRARIERARPRRLAGTRPLERGAVGRASLSAARRRGGEGRAVRRDGYVLERPTHVSDRSLQPGLAARREAPGRAHREPSARPLAGRRHLDAARPAAGAHDRLHRLLRLRQDGGPDQRRSSSIRRPRRRARSSRTPARSAAASGRRRTAAARLDQLDVDDRRPPDLHGRDRHRSRSTRTTTTRSTRARAT